ncbi:MAG TPA: CAP domain-containing protein [Candidatus Limnocylindrales bacterium]|nr:CAP domain-containing protein [Candidatus Limnocylindrales bacterium]
MHFPTSALRRTVLALAMTAAVIPAAAPAPAAAAAFDRFYADFSAQEMMRLTNLDRRAYGRSRLKVDTFLMRLAQDLSFTCPSNGNVYRGRARDMAARDYLSHSIKGCRRSDGSPYTIRDILRRAGYSSYNGENIGVNNWPDTVAKYKYGCTISGGSCNGSATSTAPVATVQRMWMQSSGHRVNILNGNFDRFGCAAWSRSDGKKFFACIFAKGGPKPLDTAAPALASLDDNVAEMRRSDNIVLQATFTDRWRLADGWVTLDGTRKRVWAYDYDVTSVTETLTLDPASLSAGTHTVVWAVRDVAGHITRKSATFEVRR